MSLSRFIIGMLWTGMIVWGTGVASAQDYPSKSIRIVTSAVGGGTDFAARIIAQGLATRFGQPVIVDNRPSLAQGTIVPKAPPDGYTLLVGGESLWISIYFEKLPHDPVKDFAPVIYALSSPNVLVVIPSLPVKSVKDLIDLAKAKKGDIDYGTGSTGSSAHLAGELFKSMTGVGMVRVPHAGTGAMINSLLSGQIPLAFSNVTAATPHIKSGKLRGIAVTSSKPTALLPGLPTVAETVPGFKFVGDVVILAPPATPPAIIARVNRETMQVLNTPESKERFLNAGFEVEGGTPQELGAWIKSETTRWGKLVKDAGLAR